MDDTMSIVWSDEVQRQFNTLWLRMTQLGALGGYQPKFNPDKLKTMMFQALTIWARQYAHMMVESTSPSVKANEMFYPFANDADVQSNRTNPMYGEGIDPIGIVKRMRSVMQLHQVTSGHSVESAMDLRARHARISYFEMCEERAYDFLRLVEYNNLTTFEVVQEQLSDANGGCEEKTIIYMQLGDCVLSEDKVTLDTAKDEFMKSVVSVTDDVLISDDPLWTTVNRLHYLLHTLEEEQRVNERKSMRIFSDPIHAYEVTERLQHITASIDLHRTELEREYVRVGKYMVNKRLRIVRDLGYVYVGMRGTKGDGWLSRTVSSPETLAGVSVDPAHIKNYECHRAYVKHRTFAERANEFVIASERATRGDLHSHIAELYHYEEACRCKVDCNDSNLEDETGSSSHSRSLPTITESMIDTLLAFPAKMSEITTPRERGIALNLTDRAGLTNDRCFGTRCFHVSSAIEVEPSYTSKIANVAMLRVMKIVDHIATTSTRSIKRVVIALYAIIRLQQVTRDAIDSALLFIKSSSVFWDEKRAEKECCGLLQTFSADDMLIALLSHLYCVQSYAALALTCTQFSKSGVLRGALPMLRTTVMTGLGCPGTLSRDEATGDVAMIRAGSLVGFKTSFGFYRPKLDGPDEWVALSLKRFTGKGASSDGSLKVELIYDEPGCSIVHNSREPVLRMGKSNGDKLTGTFSTDDLHTPVKILTTSHTVNPVAMTTYDDMVSHWEAITSQQHTAYAHKRLEEVNATRDRNRLKQCLRIQITVKRDDYAIRATSDPFVVVSNFTRAKQKRSKRQKT